MILMALEVSLLLLLSEGFGLMETFQLRSSIEPKNIKFCEYFTTANKNHVDGLPECHSENGIIFLCSSDLILQLLSLVPKAGHASKHSHCSFVGRNKSRKKKLLNIKSSITPIAVVVCFGKVMQDFIVAMT